MRIFLILRSGATSSKTSSLVSADVSLTPGDCSSVLGRVEGAGVNATGSAHLKLSLSEDRGV